MEGLFVYDFSGALIWRKDLGDLDVGPHDSMDLEWGFASSPIIAQSKVIIQADVKANPFLAAYDLSTGKLLWKTARHDVPGWSTPTLHTTRAG